MLKLSSKPDVPSSPRVWTAAVESRLPNKAQEKLLFSPTHRCTLLLPPVLRLKTNCQSGDAFRTSEQRIRSCRSLWDRHRPVFEPFQTAVQMSRIHRGLGFWIIPTTSLTAHIWSILQETKLVLLFLPWLFSAFDKTVTYLLTPMPPRQFQLWCFSSVITTVLLLSRLNWDQLSGSALGLWRRAFHRSPEGKQKAANNINMLLLSFSLSCKYNRIQTWGVT